ncbi:MAG TPA: two-component regulator propeller domain-containing protein, partial [Chitinophagaceae bacterium]|nr:two-component regulator propeller domain-containing protein [Chitinophagaceae bacterium]
MNYRILILCCLASLASSAQTMAFRFQALGVNEGLSQGNVTCMLKDHHGLMWLGTWDGLNVYDGFTNKTYRQSSNDTGSLKGSLVNSIYETHAQELYVATSQSLNRLDRRTGKFVHYNLNQTPNDIRILRQANEHLLVSVNNELWWFHLTRHAFSRVQNKVTPLWNAYFKNNKTAVNHSEFLMNSLYTFFEQQASSLPLFADFFLHHTVNDLASIGAHYVMATDDGLWVFDTQQHTFRVQFDSLKFKCMTLSGGELFVGTQTAGLWILDASTLAVKQKLRQDERQKFSISGNFVRTLYIDDQHLLWASVLGNGVNTCSLQPDPIRTILY